MCIYKFVSIILHPIKEEYKITIEVTTNELVKQRTEKERNS